MGKNLPPPAPRRPVAVAAAETTAAEAFVKGSPSASVHPVAQYTGTTSAPSARRKLVPRSDGRPVSRLVAYFDPELAKRLERYAVDQELDVSGAIVEAVRRMLGECH